MRIYRLTAKLETILETSGVALDDNTSSDFQQIMVEAEEQVILNLIPLLVFFGSSRSLTCHEKQRVFVGIL